MSSCHFQKLLPCYFLQFPPTINCGTVLSGRVHCGPRLNTCRKGQGALLLLLPLLLLHSLSSSCSPSSSSALLGPPSPLLAPPPPPPLQSRHTITVLYFLSCRSRGSICVLFSQKFCFGFLQRNRIVERQVAKSPLFKCLGKRPVCSLTRRLLPDQTSSAGTRRLHGRLLQAAARPLQGTAQGLQGPAQKLQNLAQMLQESARRLEGPKRACTKTKWRTEKLREAERPRTVNARAHNQTCWLRRLEIISCVLLE